MPRSCFSLRFFVNHQCRKCRVLSNEEVGNLCAAAVGTVKGCRSAYPDKHLQLKLHVVESQLITFVRTWRSAGLFVEDAVESLHALINKLNRRFSCMHGKMKTESKRAALAVIRRPDVIKMTADRKDRQSRGSYKKQKVD